jgi:hypothetical protein
MSTATIDLREPLLVEEVNQIAEQQSLDASDTVAEAVRRHLATYRQQRIVAETKAWYSLASEERERYKGEFIAVYGGQVVDSDPDRLALCRRVRTRYGRQPILITEGGDFPIPEYRLRL